MIPGAGAGGGDVVGFLRIVLGGDTGPLDKAWKDASKISDKGSAKLKSDLKKVAAAAGAAYLAIAGASVKAYSSFDDKMTQSIAIMGDVSASLRKEMEMTARSISRADSESRGSIQSATQLAESYYFLASAGLDARRSIDALPIVTNFATAGMFDMARATDLLTDAQSALGLASKDAAENQRNMIRTADVLVKANTVANASVEQFAIALTTKSGASMRALNKDVEEGVAILAAYADQGVKAQLAGERLNILWRSLQTAAVRNKEAWEEMNLQVFDGNGKMRHTVDILTDLENAFAGASDEQIRARLLMLGFSDESLIAASSLFGLSDNIRRYEKTLRDAGGITEEVANKQLQSLTNRFNIFKNTITDVLIEVGQGLLPILDMMSEKFFDASTKGDGLQETVALLRDTIVATTLVIGGALGDIVYGWEGVIKAGEIAILFVGERIVAGVKLTTDTIVGIMEWAVNGFVDSVNGAIQEFNAFFALVDSHNKKLPKWMQMDVELPEITEIKWKLDIDTSAVDNLDSAFKNSLELAKEEFLDLADAGRPSVNMMNDYLKRTEEARQELSKVNDEVEKLSGKPFFKVIADQVSAAVVEMKKLAVSIKEMPIPEMSFGMLGSFGGSDPFAHKETFAGGEAEELQNRLQMLEDHYAAARELVLKNTELTTRQKNELEAEMEERYAQQRETYSKARKELQIRTLQDQIAVSLGLLESYGQEQGGIYKAMFAAQQALNVVQTIMNAHVAATQALATYPPPYGNVMYGVTLALGYASAGAIAGAAIASFEGGGLTPSGTRSGGMDGRGGFLSILHPNEKVIDLQNAKNNATSSMPPININQTFTGGVTRSDLDSSAEKTRQMTLQAILEAMKRGGSFKKALQG